MSEALAHRHDVMAALSRVFRTFGYEGATLSRICAATDLPRGSLYHYFPNGKPDMLRAVLEDTETQFERHVLDRMHAPGDPRDRIRIMTRFLNGYYDKGASGCILAVLALGEGEDSSSVVVKRVFQKWIKALSAVLKDAGLPQAIAKQRAGDAIVRIQGALILCRGLGTTAPFREAVAWLHSDAFLASENMSKPAG